MSTRNALVALLIAATACGVDLASADDAVVKAPEPEAGSAIVLKNEGSGIPLYLCFSPDGKELAQVDMFGQRLIETSSWKKCRGFNVGIRMVAYSPDGKTLATAEGTDGARIWDAADPGSTFRTSPVLAAGMNVLNKPTRVLLTPAQARKQRVFWTAFSPDGRRLLTADASGHVKIWNTETWAQEADIAQTTEEVRCATFNPDGKSIAFGDTKGGLHMWDLEGKKTIGDSATPQGPIGFLTYSPDGKRLVTAHGSEKGPCLMIWRTPGIGLAQVEHGYKCAAFSKDGKIMAMGGSEIRLLSSDSMKEIRRITLPALTQREASALADAKTADQKMPVDVWALAWSPDGRQLAAGCMDGTVRVLPMDK